METHNSNNDFGINYTCHSTNTSDIYSKTIKLTTLGIPIIAKIPVVISCTEFQIHIESKIKLDSFATSIRNSVKEVTINSCKLLDNRNYRYGNLYLKGYIRESLEYAKSESTSYENRAGKIRNMIVDIPYECSTKVDYVTPPVFKTSDRLMHVEVSEIHDMPVSKSFMSLNKSISSQGLLFELEESTILDSSITTDIHSTSQETKFDKIIQDMIISIKFSLLQKQLVKISGSLSK